MTDFPRTRLTHAQFAERLTYLASHCAQWAGSCLTLPEEVNEPMRSGSVERFISEVQNRIDWLREDLARLREQESVRVYPQGHRND